MLRFHAFLCLALAFVCVLIAVSPALSATHEPDVAAVQKAAEQGDSEAQTNLGRMYAEGRGVPKNDAKAVEWFEKAAEQGHAKAQTNLGVMFATGRGVPKDDAKAVEWYRKAANRGYARAQTNLGFMYHQGRGVAKDDAKAEEWYRKAADQGDETARRGLDVMKLEGRVAKSATVQAAQTQKGTDAQATQQVPAPVAQATTPAAVVDPELEREIQKLEAEKQKRTSEFEREIQRLNAEKQKNTQQLTELERKIQPLLTEKQKNSLWISELEQKRKLLHDEWKKTEQQHEVIFMKEMRSPGAEILHRQLQNERNEINKRRMEIHAQQGLLSDEQQKLFVSRNDLEHKINQLQSTREMQERTAQQLQIKIDELKEGKKKEENKNVVEQAAQNIAERRRAAQEAAEAAERARKEAAEAERCRAYKNKLYDNAISILKNQYYKGDSDYYHRIGDALDKTFTNGRYKITSNNDAESIQIEFTGTADYGFLGAETKSLFKLRFSYRPDCNKTGDGIQFSETRVSINDERIDNVFGEKSKLLNSIFLK